MTSVRVTTGFSSPSETTSKARCGYRSNTIPGLVYIDRPYSDSHRSQSQYVYELNANEMASWVVSKVSTSGLVDHVVSNPKQLAITALTAIFGYVVVICIYRVYFHPLAKYPGPFFAKVTSLYDFYQAWSEHRAHNVLALHRKYGMWRLSRR